MGLGQVAGDEGAEAAGGAGDQDGALGVEREAARSVWLGSATAARRGTSALPSRRAIWGSSALAASAPSSACVGGLAAVAVDQGEAAGVLGVGGAQQAGDVAAARSGVSPSLARGRLR